MSKKYTLLTFKGICMIFLLELKFFLSHPVTSKQPHKIVQIHMGHPVYFRIDVVLGINVALGKFGQKVKCTSISEGMFILDYRVITKLEYLQTLDC